MTTDKPFLRGADNGSLPVVTRFLNSTTTRPPSGGDDSNSFLILATVVVAAIGLGYVYCMYVVVRRWCCCRRRDDDDENVDPSRSMLVHEGMVFDLNPAQRRQVLEVIFSETSKPVTGTEKKKKKKSRKRGEDEEEEVETDVESQQDDIPATITLSTSLDAELDEPQPVSESPLPGPENASPRPVTPDVLTQAANVPLPLSPREAPSPHQLSPRETPSPYQLSPGEAPSPHQLSPGEAPLSSYQLSRGEAPSPHQLSPTFGVSMTETCPDIRRSFGIKFASPKSTGEDDDDNDDLYVPSFHPSEDLILPSFGSDEEYKEEVKEVDDDVIRRIPLPPSIASNLPPGEASVISSNFDYYDDDETDDNVCAICLNGYEEGDVIISSKYCSHLYHKDCILEWLDKHDVCPCCRIDMVTENEINKAATSLVGKTRMYKAVASLKQIHHHHTPPPSPRVRSPAPNARPNVISPRVRRVNGHTR